MKREKGQVLRKITKVLSEVCEKHSGRCVVQRTAGISGLSSVKTAEVTK